MTNMFRILLLLVVPGHLIFSFTISLLEAGHTIPTFLFVITYLAAVLLQVCKLAAGKKIIIKWSNFINFNNVKQNRTSCCISNFIQVYPTLSNFIQLYLQLYPIQQCQTEENQLVHLRCVYSSMFAASWSRSSGAEARTRTAPRSPT